MRWLLVHPMTYLVAYSALCCAVFRLGGSRLPAEIARAARFGWGLMLAMWTDADARLRRVLPCDDFGLLVVIFFPLSLVWYCFWSRGWRGAILFIGLLTLVIAPYTITGLIWWILHG